MAAVSYQRIVTITRRTLVGLVLLAGAWVYFYRITQPSLWLDELWHREIGLRPYQAILHDEAGYGRHVQMSHGYYLINRYCERLFGNAEFSVRAPQAVAAVLSLLMVYLLGRHMFGAEAGLWASVLLVVNVFYVRYAQENRFYQMSSCCFLASYYFFVRYLETSQWRYWAGFTLVACLFVRLQQFGMVALIMLALLFGIVAIAQLLAGEGQTYYEVSWKKLLYLGAAGAVVLLQWMPYPARVVRWMLAGESTGALDGFWTEPFGCSLPAVAGLMTRSFFSGPVLQPWHVVPVGAAVIGSILYRRSRAVLFVLYCMLVTLPIIHAMNTSRAVVLSKRMLYLVPVLALLLGGGVTMLARMAATVVALLERWGTQWRRAAGRLVYPAAWSVIALTCSWPILSREAESLLSYYYTERVENKFFARMLRWYANPRDEWWTSKSLWHWVATYPPGNLPVRDHIPSGTELSQTGITGVLAKARGLWLCDIDPGAYGIPPLNVIHLTCMDPNRSVGLFLLRGMYASDGTAREYEEERLLLGALQATDYPKPYLAERAAALLRAHGSAALADKVMSDLADYRASAQACQTAARYFERHGMPEKARACMYRYADAYFWLAAVQLRAASIALAGGDYGAARRYAWRARWLPCDEPFDLGKAEEIMARAYYGEQRYTHASRWAQRAARVWQASGQRRFAGALRDILTLNEECQRHLSDDFGQVRLWLEKWAVTMDFAEMKLFEEQLDAIQSADARWQRFMKQAQRHRRVLPPLAHLASAIQQRDNLEALRSHLARLKQTTTAVSWPVYMYAIERLAPTNWYPDLVIAPKELKRLGFPDPSGTPINSDVWIGNYYERLSGWAAKREYWQYILERTPPEKAWNAAMVIATIECQYMGITTNAVPLLKAYVGIITNYPAQAAQCARLLEGLGTAEAAELARQMRGLPPQP